MRTRSVARDIFRTLLGKSRRHKAHEKLAMKKRKLLMESLEERRVFAGFTAGNIAVYRVGDGGAALSNAATAVFIDEYTPSGTLVQSIAMPTAEAGAQKILTASGTATSEGLLNLSSDGEFLVLTGYSAALATANVAGTNAATNPRVIGRIGVDGLPDTSTSLNNAFSANNIRSATSPDGTTFYATGANTGVVKADLAGTAGTTIASNATNLRGIQIFNGQLYISSGAGTTRLATVGTGIPTTAGQTITNLPGMPTGTVSNYQFFLADLSSDVAGVDTAYVADDGAGALTKFSLVAGSWVLNNSIGVNADDYRGLTGMVSGSTATLFATRDNGTGADTIVSVVDASGYNANMTATPTTIATASANTAIRGIALTPISVNDAPRVPPIADARTPVGVPKRIRFTVSDDDNDVNTFTNDNFTVTSDNQALVRDSNIILIGSGRDRELMITPEPGAEGTVQISIRVSDGTDSSTRTFNLSMIQSRLVYSIDLDPDTEGVQDTRSFKRNDTVTAAVVMELVGAMSISSYSFSVRWDTDELDFVSRDETPLPGWFNLGDDNPVNEVAGNAAPFGNYGEATRFAAGTLETGGLAPLTFEVARMSFNAAHLTGVGGDVDIRAGAFEASFDEFFDDDGNNIGSFDLITFNGANVSFDNTDPVISDILDQTITQGTSTNVLDFQVDDLEQAPEFLIVSATSSNAALVPNGNITLGGGGQDRTIQVTPLAGQSGTTTITVTVSDGFRTSSDTFDVIVESTGGLVDPTITVTSGDKVYDGAAYVPTTTVTGSAGDVANPAITYTYFVGVGTGGTNLGASAPVDVGTYTVVAAFAGNASYNPGSAQKTFDVTRKSITIATATADNKVYDGTTSAVVSAITLSGVVAGDVGFVGAAGNGAFADKNVGTGKTVNVSGVTLSGTRAFNYVLSSDSTTTTADITARSLTVTATGQNKVYDGTTTATVTLADNRVAGDTLTAAFTAANFDNKNVGTAKPVSVTGISISGADAGNYSLSSTTADTTADITARSLTVTATGQNKVYDGTTTATVSLADNRVAGDTLTAAFTAANFDNKNVGVGKTVSVTGISISGTDAGNYSLSSTSASTTADITARSLTVTATGQNKVYDGTTTATVTLADNRVAGDTLTAAFTAANFDNKNVGTAKPVSVTGISISGADAGNYSLSNTTADTTADITARSLTVTATGQNKVYDGTTTATVTLADNRVAGDTLTAAFTAANFDNKNVGTAKPVSVTGISISGADAGNYSLSSTTADTSADITARSLTVTATGQNKVYDGTTTATVTLADNRVAGDTLTAAFTAANFDNKNVGTAKPVSVTGISISGADAGNYSLSSTTADTSADITARSLTVTATGQNKVYDGTTTAGATLADNRVAGDALTTSMTAANFDNKNVGTGKPISVTGISISGADAGNYTLANTTANTTGDITARALVVTATGQNKVYDGNTSATVSLSDDRIAGDTLTTAFTAAAFDNKNVGTGKQVSVTGISISGADAGNYTPNTTATTTADITRLAILGSVTVADKAFDGNTSATITARTLAGAVPGDDVTYVGGVATFADPDVGNNKPVTASGLSLAGADAGNYTVNSTANTFASILAVPAVSQIRINGEDPNSASPFALQRSILHSVVVTFTEPVILTPGAFRLRNTTFGVNLAESQLIVSPAGGASQVFVITFGAGASVNTRVGQEGNSLSDGNYMLTVDATKVTSEANAAPMIADHVFGPGSTLPGKSVDKFFRFFGDTDGDGDVDGTDLQVFRLATVPTVPTYNSLVDFDGDGIVKGDVEDLNEFRRNLQRKFRL